MKIAEFANSVDLDEVAHNEPPHLDLYCLLSSHDIAWTSHFFENLQMEILFSAFR